MISKVKPAVDYPPERGCYLRGNDFSPVAVVVLLRSSYQIWPFSIRKVPDEIEELVRVSIEAGAALAGTLQTANIGIEKIVCNVIANPNIRYLVVCGREAEWHGSGDALRKLVENGVDRKQTIIGCSSLSPCLFNIPLRAIERFRKQITLIDLLGETKPETVQKAVWSCYQEQPTRFQEYTLRDPGAYPDEPLSIKITWRIGNLWQMRRYFRFTWRPVSR